METDKDSNPRPSEVEESPDSLFFPNQAVAE